MAIQQRSEIERKYKVGTTTADLSVYKKKFTEHGFVFVDRQIETDYLPDTIDGLCKKNGLLLRFRQVRKRDQTQWLLTLKTRSKTEGVLDFHEIETAFDDGENETFHHINQVLNQTIGHTLNPDILTIKALNQLKSLLQADGFVAHRILLDKYRQVYEKNDDHLTLDFFPDGMGAYIEVESYTVASLEVVCEELGLEAEFAVTDDYGDLLKLHKKDLSYEEQRTALFSATEVRDLLETTV